MAPQPTSSAPLPWAGFGAGSGGPSNGSGPGPSNGPNPPVPGGSSNGLPVYKYQPIQYKNNTMKK
jgi:hypothetical protein